MTLQIQIPNPDAIHAGLGKLRQEADKAKEHGEKVFKDADRHRQNGSTLSDSEVRRLNEAQAAVEKARGTYREEEKVAAEEAGLHLRGLASYREAQKNGLLAWAAQLEPFAAVVAYQCEAMNHGISLPLSQQWRNVAASKTTEFREFRLLVRSLDDGVLDLASLPTGCAYLMEVPL